MAGRGTVQLRGGKDVILRVENLVQEFPVGRNRVVHAVSDISFDLRKGETLGIVGESGCGKSTTARALVQLPPPTSGRVVLDPGSENEIDLTALSGNDLRDVRPRLQMIFQDPISSLNPRRRVRPGCGTQPGGRHQGASGVVLVSRTGPSCSGTDPRTGTRWAGWW